MESTYMATGARQEPHPEEPDAVSPLDGVELPVAFSEVLLASGRRCSMRTEPEGDRLTVRARNGQVVLRVLITEAGPVLSFESADIAIAGTRRLTLSAQDVSIDASRSMEVNVEGDMTQTIAGARHTSVRGAERLEASSVEIQANEEAVCLRAAGRIGLDGEHVGLNDEPCLAPFAWSAVATSSRPEEG
jgi:hypothetical protein